MNNHMKLRALCEGAVLVAIAQVLSYLKLWEMPWGGSVVLSMVPLVLYAVRWGLGAGLLSGFVFGVLQFMFDGGHWLAVHHRRLSVSLYGAWSGWTGGAAQERRVHRYSYRRFCPFPGTLRGRRYHLEGIYARDVLRPDDAQPLVLFPAV